MLCGKCKSTRVAIEADPPYEILVCAVCGWRKYRDSKTNSQHTEAETRWQAFKESQKHTGKRKVTDKDWTKMINDQFEEFRKSRRNTAQQRLWMKRGVELPGKWDVSTEASKWMSENLKGKVVVDVRADMGGYCIEAARRGAKRVIGLEGELTTVEAARDLLTFAREFDAETDYSVVEYRKFSIDSVLDVQADLLLCVSTLHRSQHPKWLLANLRHMVRPNGLLVFEVKNGDSPYVYGENLPEKINSWYPTHEAMLRSLVAMGLQVETYEQGRAVGRMMYRCRLPKGAPVLADADERLQTTIAAQRRAAKLAEPPPPVEPIAAYAPTPPPALVIVPPPPVEVAKVEEAPPPPVPVEAKPSWKLRLNPKWGGKKKTEPLNGKANGNGHEDPAATKAPVGEDGMEEDQPEVEVLQT